MEYTKEQVIGYITSGNFPLEFLYQFYVKSAEKKRLEIKNIQEFQRAINIYLRFNSQAITETLMIEYQINRLEDKQGNIIKLL